MITCVVVQKIHTEVISIPNSFFSEFSLRLLFRSAEVEIPVSLEEYNATAIGMTYRLEKGP
jgi:hypothetical protein